MGWAPSKIRALCWRVVEKTRHFFGLYRVLEDLRSGFPESPRFEDFASFLPRFGFLSRFYVWVRSSFLFLKYVKFDQKHFPNGAKK
jgi:hypothetical protein